MFSVNFFIFTQDGGVLYEPLDVKIMLRNCGLISQIATNWLISLQDELQSKLPHRDRPSIIDLLQVAVLVCQQSSRGVELQSSLWQMSNEVYVRSLRSNSSKEVCTFSRVVYFLLFLSYCVILLINYSINIEIKNEKNCDQSRPYVQEFGSLVFKLNSLDHFGRLKKKYTQSSILESLLEKDSLPHYPIYST